MSLHLPSPWSPAHTRRQARFAERASATNLDAMRELNEHARSARQSLSQQTWGYDWR